MWKKEKLSVCCSLLQNVYRGLKKPGKLNSRNITSMLQHLRSILVSKLSRLSAKVKTSINHIRKRQVVYSCYRNWDTSWIQSLLLLFLTLRFYQLSLIVVSCIFVIKFIAFLFDSMLCLWLVLGFFVLIIDMSLTRFLNLCVFWLSDC